ncbi:hypothetical protein EWM64_g1511 [Hericium alpestre]|uniref:NADH:flavin oxidoreductase/NADH oxidase N-terminal domain-containing protein n=1 Tax=Hericium alpestre TaxID=135208 RepID=A0A4Z0A7N6_9AGAM|nr:hypothetical protein EWM64_g1511 [Hericium alpestre]
MVVQSHTPIIVNKAVPGLPYFSPAQTHPAGSAVDPQPDGKPIPKLFQPLKIRGVAFQNRIFLAPLGQNSASDGAVTQWHLAHLGGIFTRGPGLSFVEATAVSPEGRTSPEDSGLWAGKHEEPLRNIVEFAHSQGQKIGIQLAHAGRKASTVAPWLHRGMLARPEAGGWPDDVVGSSPVPWDEHHAIPKELSKEGIRQIVRYWVEAAKRAIRIGFDVIEIHNAHGYLLHSFVSPVSNKRTDEYGGSFENRIRLTLEIVDAIRAVIPDTMPLFLRISATDWLEESLPEEPSWRLEDTVRIAPILAAHGVDLFDISSGGLHPAQRLDPEGAYQAPFSAAVKQAAGDKILVGAVGGITTGTLAQEILDKEQADVIFVGRTFQKNPGTVWSFAEDLGIEIHKASQIAWGFKARRPVPSAEKV